MQTVTTIELLLLLLLLPKSNCDHVVMQIQGQAAVRTVQQDQVGFNLVLVLLSYSW